MLLFRVELPDRPGALGEVATALGNLGVDILTIDIVERRHSTITVVDDFLLDLPPGVMADSLVSACNAIPGVKVMWLSMFPDPGGVENDAAVIEKMMAAPGRRAEALTRSAPKVFHCRWAVLIDTKRMKTLEKTRLAPELGETEIEQLAPLNKTHRFESSDLIPQWGEVLLAIAPAPAERAIVLGRSGGPEFLDSELKRLEHLASLTG